MRSAVVLGSAPHMLVAGILVATIGADFFRSKKNELGVASRRVPLFQPRQAMAPAQRDSQQGGFHVSKGFLPADSIHSSF